MLKDDFKESDKDGDEKLTYDELKIAYKRAKGRADKLSE